jgi:bacterioferritin-associated ferredoxin
MKIEVKISGRDQIELVLDVDAGIIKTAQVKAIGCHSLLEEVDRLRKRLSGELELVTLPETNDHAAMLVREVLLKAKSQWDFPYKEVELCHCRAVPTSKVDEAIVTGAHRVEDVGEITSAGTACGSCRPDTQKIIDFRLCKKAG